MVCPGPAPAVPRPRASLLARRRHGPGQALVVVITGHGQVVLSQLDSVSPCLLAKGYLLKSVMDRRGEKGKGRRTVKQIVPLYQKICENNLQKRSVVGG